MVLRRGEGLRGRIWEVLGSWGGNGGEECVVGEGDGDGEGDEVGRFTGCWVAKPQS